jgi:hypothetical protein
MESVGDSSGDEDGESEDDEGHEEKIGGGW